MHRRQVLRSLALATVPGIAGCTGDPEEPTNDAGENDGGTDPGDAGSEELVRGANEFGYDTIPVQGVAVPLVPIADAFEWYKEGETLFADARDRTSYQESRIAGSVFSPAPDGQSEDDPVAAKPSDTRVVTYCTCPHHLSSMRAANLIPAGFEHTYALDEGFMRWMQLDYPVASGETARDLNSYEINGRTATDLAGTYVWARHEPSGQREAAPVRADGRFSLQLHFYDVPPSADLTIETTETRVVAPVGELSQVSITL